MSNEKKNPLIGAFRAPPVGTPPSPTQPAKQPETPKNVKAPATPLSAPILTKLEESKKLIREGKMNFTQIAAQLQYSTVHHFSRQFKEKFGLTPTEYARAIR